MIWIDVIRMKWRESVHGLLQARDGTQRVLTGYPSQLFDENPTASPRSEQQEQELVWNMHPSTRKLHVAFHSLLYNFYTHKDLALPLDLQERIQAMGAQHGASTSQTSSSQTYRNLRAKPTLAAQARHLKLSKLLHVMDKLIVVQEKMFKRLDKQTNLSEWVQDSLKRLFEVLEDECDNIVDISVKFSTAKEDRFQMEQDINLITDAFQRILSGFHDVIQSWTDVVGNVRGAEVAAAGAGEDPWPDQTTIEELREGLPEGYKVDYDFLEAVLKEAEDEEMWLENGYSSSSSSSGDSDQEEEDEERVASPCEKPTIEAEVHHEEDIIQTEQDDQPIILAEKTAEKNKSANNGSSKISSRNGYQVLA